jgi:hypothetical protein
MFSPPSQPRTDWRAEGATASAAVLALAWLSPIGLASHEAADLAAGSLGVRRPVGEVTALADIFGRLASLLPLGEAGTRSHWVAVLGGAIALAVMAARLRASARPALAVAAGLLLVGVSRSFLETATVRPGRSVDFALFVLIALLLELIRRDRARSRVGLGLALACGLAAGADWPIRAATWPVALGLTIWALRRGERWPLLAPTLFVAGTGIALGGVVSAAPGGPGIGGLMFHQIISPRGVLEPVLVLSLLRAAMGSVPDDAGVFGLLVAGVGAGAFFVRARGEAFFYTVLWGAGVGASVLDGDVVLARLLVIGALSVPVAAGIASLAQSFGRARIAATVVLGVIVILPPAVVGVGSAIGAPGRHRPNAVARRLDAAVGLPMESLVSPAFPDAAPWSRYAAALGGRQTQPP